MRSVLCWLIAAVLLVTCNSALQKGVEEVEKRSDDSVTAESVTSLLKQPDYYDWFEDEPRTRRKGFMGVVHKGIEVVNVGINYVNGAVSGALNLFGEKLGPAVSKNFTDVSGMLKDAYSDPNNFKCGVTGSKTATRASFEKVGCNKCVLGRLSQSCLLHTNCYNCRENKGHCDNHFLDNVLDMLNSCNQTGDACRTAALSFTSVVSVTGDLDWLGRTFYGTCYGYMHDFLKDAPIPQ